MSTDPRVILTAGDLTGDDRDSRWEDAEGCIWTHTGDYWVWRGRYTGIRHAEPPRDFPWTEVTQ